MLSQSVSQSSPLIDMNSVTFRHTIGQARCWREKSLVHVDYTGVITIAVMQAIGPQVVEFCGPDVVLIRLDRAVLNFPYPISVTENVCLAGFGVLVVRPEHRLAALAHCLHLARAGIYRVAYPVAEILDAYHLAKRRAETAACTRLLPGTSRPLSLAASCRTSTPTGRHHQSETAELSRLRVCLDRALSHQTTRFHPVNRESCRSSFP